MGVYKVRTAYNNSGQYKLTEEERREAEELGLLERESSITKILKLVRILNKNGVDFTQIKLTRVTNQKQEFILLKDIEQDGIDIEKIIKENKLDPNFKIGMGIVNLRSAYNNSETYKITEEERREADGLGLIPIDLRRRIEQKQQAIEQNRKARELYKRGMREIYGNEITA